jgi:hypothetical protein
VLFEKMFVWLMLFILVVASIVTITLLSVNFHKSKKTEIIVEGAVPNITVEASRALPPTVVNNIETPAPTVVNNIETPAPTVVNNIETPAPTVNVNNNISADMEFATETPELDIVEVEEEPESLE